MTAISRRRFLGTAVAAASACAPAPTKQWGSNDGNAVADDWIDAHVHVYPPETPRYPLCPGARRDQLPFPSFTPEELLAHAAPCGVRRFVLIQYSFYGADNSYILDLLGRHPDRFAVVGRIEPPDNPRTKLQELARRGMRGLRVVGTAGDTKQWAGDPFLQTLWRIAGEERIVICPLINPPFLPAVETLCRRFPATPVVMDHCARIGADGQIRPSDLDALCRLADYPQVQVKVSAFWALGKKQPPYLDLAPMIRRLWKSFGSERLMWGSDAPYQVCAPHSYRDSFELLRSRLDFLTPHDRRRLLRSTAECTFFR